MAFIVEQFTADRGVQLGVESFTRAFPWGVSWNKIRIGCRLAINGSSTIPTSADPWGNVPMVGICTGPEAWASSVTVDALGVNPVNTLSVTYSGSAPNFFYDVGSNNITFRQKVGDTANYLGNYATSRICVSANPTALRTPLLLDIIKTSATQAKLTWWFANNTQVLIDCTRSNFMSMMENENAPINLTSGTQTLTLVRQVEDWDSLFLHWGRAVPTSTFYDISAVRFY